MVNIMMGPEGSGKTKLLINAINNSVKHETGSMVCIESGNALRFDVDHRGTSDRCERVCFWKLYVPARVPERSARRQL